MADPPSLLIINDGIQAHLWMCLPSPVFFHYIK